MRVGRPPIGKRAMTAAERQRRHRTSRSHAMTNDEYVAELSAARALSFVDDCRRTLPAIHAAIDRSQQPDETPRQYSKRLGDARSRLERLMLRLQDNQLEAKP